MGLGGELAREAPRRGRLLVVLLISAAVGVGCGGGGDGQASPSELESLLLPAGGLPVEVQRSFEWDNPTDFTAQGLSLPGDTEPSEAVDVIERAGFEAAAGQLLAPSGGGPVAYSEVAKFESEGGARATLDYLHAQDLLKPCSGACAVIARPLTLTGIPSAKGAHQAPVGDNSSPPGAAGQFERYVVEFTVGPYLYIGKVTATPGVVAKSLFIDGVESFYGYVRKHTR